MAHNVQGLSKAVELNDLSAEPPQQIYFIKSEANTMQACGKPYVGCSAY